MTRLQRFGITLTLLALSLPATGARAQGSATVADFVGPYSFAFEVQTTYQETGLRAHDLVGLGVITFDGAGGLSGFRLIHEPSIELPTGEYFDGSDEPLPFQANEDEPYRQAFTGTYAVNAEGDGVLELQMTNSVLYERATAQVGSAFSPATHYPVTLERVHFVASDGGRQLTGTQLLKVDYVWDHPDPTPDSVGSTRVRLVFSAQSQKPACGSPARIVDWIIGP